MGATQRKSYGSVLEPGIDGERVFALQYCPVRFERTVRLGGFMGWGVRRVKKARLYGGGWWYGVGLVVRASDGWR